MTPREWLERKGLMWVGYLVLAGLMAGQAASKPRRASFLWIAAAAMGVTALFSLLYEQVPWIRDRTRVGHIYLVLILFGLGIGASALVLKPAQAGVLFGVAGVVILVPLGLWTWLWIQRRRIAREWPLDQDDTHRPR